MDDAMGFAVQNENRLKADHAHAQQLALFNQSMQVNPDARPLEQAPSQSEVREAEPHEVADAEDKEKRGGGGGREREGNMGAQDEGEERQAVATGDGQEVDVAMRDPGEAKGEGEGGGGEE
eukprot:3576214-Rhodomonas_salina.1